MNLADILNESPLGFLSASFISSLMRLNFVSTQSETPYK